MIKEKSEKQIEEKETPVFEWTTHPMKKRPVATVIVTIFILVTSMLVFYATSSKFFTIGALLVLFLSTAKFYLPTKFKFTDKSVSIKTTSQTIKKNWKDFRSFYPDKNGVLLSPFLEPSRLENFRGMYLIFSSNRDEVISHVKKYIQVETDESTNELETSA